MLNLNIQSQKDIHSSFLQPNEQIPHIYYMHLHGSAYIYIGQCAINMREKNKMLNKSSVPVLYMSLTCSDSFHIHFLITVKINVITTK